MIRKFRQAIFNLLRYAFLLAILFVVGEFVLFQFEPDQLLADSELLEVEEEVFSDLEEVEDKRFDFFNPFVERANAELVDATHEEIYFLTNHSYSYLGAKSPKYILFQSLKISFS